MKKQQVNIVLAPLKFGVNVHGIEYGAEVLIASNKISNYTLLNFLEVSESFHNNKMKFLNTVFYANKKIYNKVKEIINIGNFPLLIGGDHSVAIGSIAAVSEYIDNIGVIWIDAHGDMNTDQTTVSGNIHGMPLAILQGLGNKKLTNLVGRKIKTENIVVFGTRDLDNEEEDLMKSINLKYISFDSISKNNFKTIFLQAVSYLKQNTNKLHISFDLDSMNPEVIKGVSTPVSGGFNSNDVEYMIDELFANFSITSMDIVEYNPEYDTNGETLLELIKIINNVHRNNKKIKQKEEQ